LICKWCGEWVAFYGIKDHDDDYHKTLLYFWRTMHNFGECVKG